MEQLDKRHKDEAKLKRAQTWTRNVEGVELCLNFSRKPSVKAHQMLVTVMHMRFELASSCIHIFKRLEHAH